jgi:hypothetical protein
MVFFLILGLALRCYHYLRDPSMWHDEAALVLNVLGKSFTDLLGPLYFSEAAPPLFLWIEKAMAGLLGDGTYALRLVPFLASCAGFLGLFWIARRVLSPAAALWAMVLFGCSDRLLWHCCEAKPYAMDVFIATGLLFALVHTEQWPVNRQVLLYSCCTPVLIFLSYPACFLVGGTAMGLLPAVVRARRTGTWMAYALFCLVLAGSFLLLLVGPIHSQRDQGLLDCWQDMFPSWDRPWTVPGWLAVKVTEVVRYTDEPIGNLLVPVAVLGGLGLWRSGQRRLLALCVWPVALAALAGLLGKYPFAATRVMVFAGPAMMLLAAAGLPPAFAWLLRWGRLSPILLAGLCLLPVGQAVYRVGWPWPRFDSARAAAFIRTHGCPGDLVAGTSWEHAYYFRDQKPLFHSLIPIPADPASLGEKGRREAMNTHQGESRLWLVAAGKTEAERQGYLEILQSMERWNLVAQIEFGQTTLFYLARTGRKEKPFGKGTALVPSQAIWYYGENDDPSHQRRVKP